MKRNIINAFSLIILLSALTAAYTPYAFAELQIYKVKGNVTVSKGKRTSPAKRRDAVGKTDVLGIPKEGKAEILDTDTRRIYSSKGSGKMSVKTLMDKADAHASSITRNINRKVMAAVADNATSNRSAYEAIGMAIHETDAVADPPVILPEGMSYLAYLMQDSTDNEGTHQCQISLRLAAEDKEDDGGGFNFALNNRMWEPLFFNIIKKGEDNDIRLLLPANPVAESRSEAIVKEYTFLPDSIPTEYIAIASTEDFSAEDIRKLLKADYRPTASYYLTFVRTQ